MSNNSYVTAIEHSDDSLRLVIRLLSEGITFPKPGHRPSWAALLLCAVDDALEPTSEWNDRMWRLADQIKSIDLVRLRDYPETTDRRLAPEERDQPEMEVLLCFREPVPFAERMAAYYDDRDRKWAHQEATKALGESWNSWVSANDRRNVSYWREETGWTKARIHKVVPKRWKGTVDEARQLLRSACIAASHHPWDVLPEWAESFDTLAFTMDFVHTTTVINKLPPSDPRVENMLAVLLGDREKRIEAALRLGTLGLKASEQTQRVLARVHAGDSLTYFQTADNSEPQVAWAMWRVTGDRQYVDPYTSKPRAQKELRRSLEVHARGIALDATMWPWPESW